MQDLNDLYYFVQVVDHGGFAEAERATGIPKSRLSRRVAQLEKSLNAELLYRTTRKVHTTQIGHAYYQHCTAMLVEAQAAADTISLAHAEPCGTLCISCPPQLLHFVVSPMLVQFMATYPRVKLEIKALGRRVDPVHEGIDMAIRVRFPPHDKEENLDTYHLSNSPQKLLAAPSLLATLPAISSPDQLDTLPTLDWERPDDTWQFIDMSGKVTRPIHHPRIITDDLSTLHHAALAGLGIAQLPLLLAQDDLATGRLQEVLPSYRLPMGEVQAVLPSQRSLLPAAKALLDHLSASFGQYDINSL